MKKLFWVVIFCYRVLLCVGCDGLNMLVEHTDYDPLCGHVAKTFVLRDGTKKLGSALFCFYDKYKDSDYALLNSLHIEKEERCKGYGRILFNSVVEYLKLRSKGSQILTWVASPEDDDDSNEPLKEKKEFKRLVGFYKSLGAEFIESPWMKLDLK